MSDLWTGNSYCEGTSSLRAPPPYAATPTIILDQCPLFREGLKEAFGGSMFMVVASAADIKDVHLSDAQSSAPLLVILAATYNVVDDLAALKLARAQFPNSTTVSLCRDCQTQHAAALLGAGVDAILPVPSQPEGFVEALELVMLGQHVVPLHIMEFCVGSGEFTAQDELLTNVSPAGADRLGMRLSSLSTREVEIVQCLLAGEQNRSIARRLMISEATVKVHVKAILRKIKVKNRTQAAIWALNNIDSESVPASLIASQTNLSRFVLPLLHSS